MRAKNPPVKSGAADIMGSFVGTIWRFVQYCDKEDVGGTAAKTAFFFLLSIFPLCMMAGWALAYFDLDLRLLEGLLPHHMLDVLPDHKAAPGSGGITSPVLTLTTLWAASNAVWALMKGVGLRTKAFWQMVRARLMALLFTFCFLGVIALSLAFLAVSRWMNMLLVATALFFLLFILYRYTPGSALRGRRAAFTALGSAVSWLAASRLFELYMRYLSNYEALYGSFGIFLGLALWVLVICFVIIAGAKLAAFIISEQGEKEGEQPLD